MLEKFKKFILSNNLIPKGQTILLAVSGGIDSMVLVDLFRRANIDFAIGHVNYNLRENDSILDAQFVKQKAEELKVHFHHLNIHLMTEAKSLGQSVQMAARDVRYNWLEETRKENNYFAFATAHHANDEAETFFLNLTAGCGIKGLHGIPLRRNHIIRPILFMNKSEVVQYSKDNQVTHREDVSNASNYYMRNFIRNKIVPLFEELNPQFIPVMQTNISRIREAEELYDYAVTRFLNDILKVKEDIIEIDIEKLDSLSFKNTLLYEAVKEYGFTSGQTEDMLNSLEGSGKQFMSKSHRLIIDRDKMFIKTLNEPVKDSSYFINENDKSLDLPTSYLRFSIEDKPREIIKSNNVFYVDYDKLKFPLEIRSWRHGDFFYPIGMEGKKKKLKEFFIDNKLTLFDKEDIRLLISGEDVVLILGHRMDERFKITTDTKRCFRITTVPK